MMVSSVYMLRSTPTKVKRKVDHAPLESIVELISLS